MTAAERETVHLILSRLDDIEAHRRELREQDEHWRASTDAVLATIRAELRQLSERIDAVPSLIDERIRACRAEREQVTGPAVQMARNGAAVNRWIERHTTRVAWAIAVANGLLALGTVVANIVR